nr:hypothetical protein [Thiomicrorhabdus sp.]
MIHRQDAVETLFHAMIEEELRDRLKQIGDMERDSQSSRIKFRPPQGSATTRPRVCQPSATAATSQAAGSTTPAGN